MAIGLTVVQSSDGTQYTATDISTGITVTSRVLTIFDSTGALIQTINMGVSLTATYGITTDKYLTFTLTLNGSITKSVTVLSTRFYDLQALTLEQALDCTCKSSKSLCNNATLAMMAKDRAITFFEFGQGVSSQRNIDAANDLIENPLNCGC